MNNKKKALPVVNCVECGYKMDAATLISPNADVELPREGDVSICGDCGNIMQYNAEYKLIPATLEVRQFVLADRKFVKYISAIREKGLRERQRAKKLKEFKQFIDKYGVDM